MRVYLDGTGGRHYPPYAPRVIWHRVTHRLFGPLLGCSCSRCFTHPWRLYYWREGVHDRVRIARIEEALRREGIKLHG